MIMWCGFVPDAVAELDVSALRARYRLGGVGPAGV
jgi:hypothetical protein